jgi:YD repeat-containing protein
MAYNLLGSVQTVTDPIQKQTLFTFDTLGRTETIKPYYTSAVETLAYDQAGNVIRRTSPDGCALDLVYDEMGRLVSRFTSNPTVCERAAVNDEFGYDARGLLVAAQNAHVGLIREYDALGRMEREIDTRFGSAVGYAWDKASRDGAGRTVGISDPFGETTRFVYEAAGRRVKPARDDGDGRRRQGLCLRRPQPAGRGEGGAPDLTIMTRSMMLAAWCDPIRFTRPRRSSARSCVA